MLIGFAGLVILAIIFRDMSELVFKSLVIMIAYFIISMVVPSIVESEIIRIVFIVFLSMVMMRSIYRLVKKFL
jgi:hypothetical protein